MELPVAQCHNLTKRRGRDSNPGTPHGDSGFQDLFSIATTCWQRESYSHASQSVAQNVAHFSRLTKSLLT